MWDLRTFKCVQTMHHNSGSIYAILVENTSIFAATYEHTIGIWDTRTFQCLQNLPGNQLTNTTPLCVLFVINKRSSHQRTFLFQGHSGAVYSLGISGQRMFSGSYDTTIRVSLTQ
jgi:WD40 repeat protein